MPKAKKVSKPSKEKAKKETTEEKPVKGSTSQLIREW